MAAAVPAPGFEALFGRPPAVASRAPGRVNLIGEHTDYSGGFVLPLAIPQTTLAELSPRSDLLVRAFSASVGPGGDGVGEGERREYTLGEEKAGRGWLDYVQGVTSVLGREGFALRGFDLRISSSVPLGSGLSSSAALEVSLLRALRQVFSLDLDDVRLALLGQRAEHDFVGAPVGMMDQMASSLADGKGALFLDTRYLRYERVPLPDGLELIVIDSGVAHRHSSGDYRVRRAECERAAALLGVPQLRDLSVADLPRALEVPEPLGRRVRHVVTENARVLEAVEALRSGDLGRLGKLLDASHRSQADDFEVSIPEVDLLAELLRQETGVVGARLTGGGFGGSVLGAVRAGPGVAEAAARVARAYASRTAARPKVLLPQGSCEGA